MSTDEPITGDVFGWYVGIDWGTAEHAIEVSDGAGHLVAARPVAHTSSALSSFVDWLAEVSGGHLARVAVAIEVPRGAVVELLLERGAAVFALNPKQLDRFRDRFTVAGAKDDRLDARVLCSAVRTDRACFRRLAVDEPFVIRVRELIRASEVLDAEFHALTNRLRELVHRIAPEWLTLSPAAADPWFWTVLERVATPELGRHVRRRHIERILTAARIRRLTTDDVLDVLTRPPLPVAPGTLEAVTAHVQLLLSRVRLVAGQRELCERELNTVLEELDEPPPPSSADASAESGHPSAPGDVAILRSVPGIGPKVTAWLLAEARALLALRDYESLRTLTGVAPVRRQTGKNKRGTVSMRYACNLRLRNACYHWARISTQVDAVARHY
jgi:transposase